MFVVELGEVIEKGPVPSSRQGNDSYPQAMSGANFLQDTLGVCDSPGEQQEKQNATIAAPGRLFL